MTSIHLAKFEQDRIEQVVDDSLAGPHAMKPTRGLTDQYRRVAHFLARPGALRHHRRWKVFFQFLGKVPRANAGAGHALANHVLRRDHNREHSPSIMPRMLDRPRSSSFRSSAMSAGSRPTPGCIRATR